MAKKASRPDDPYHRALFKRVIRPQRDNEIEMSGLRKDIPTKYDDEEKISIEMEEGNHMPYEIKPGTPRRRIKNMLI